MGYQTSSFLSSTTIVNFPTEKVPHKQIEDESESVESESIESESIESESTFKQFCQSDLVTWVKELSLTPETKDKLLSRVESKFWQDFQKNLCNPPRNLKTYLDYENIKNEDDRKVILDSHKKSWEKNYGNEGWKRAQIDSFNKLQSRCCLHLIEQIIEETEESQENATNKGNELVRRLCEKKKCKFIHKLTKEKIDVIKKMMEGLRETKLEKKEEMIKVLKENPRICVIGNVNSGKSTLINTILGEEVVPCKDGPCTSAVVSLKYCSSKVEETIKMIDPKTKSIKKSNVSEAEFLELSKKKHTSNPPQKVCHKFEKYISQDILKFITLVDTPGLNDEDYFTDAVKSSLKSADMILALVGLDGLGKEVKGIIKNLQDSEKKNIIYVVNKFDMVDEKDKEEKKDDIRNEIKSVHHGVLDEQIHFVSTKEARDPPVYGNFKKLETTIFKQFEKLYKKRVHNALRVLKKHMENVLSKMECFSTTYQNFFDEEDLVKLEAKQKEINSCVERWRKSARKEIEILKNHMESELTDFWSKSLKKTYIKKSSVEKDLNYFIEEKKFREGFQETREKIEQSYGQLLEDIKKCTLEFNSIIFQTSNRVNHKGAAIPGAAVLGGAFLGGAVGGAVGGIAFAGAAVVIGEAILIGEALALGALVGGILLIPALAIGGIGLGVGAVKLIIDTSELYEWIKEKGSKNEIEKDVNEFLKGLNEAMEKIEEGLEEHSGKLEDNIGVIKTAIEIWNDPEIDISETTKTIKMLKGKTEIVLSNLNTSISHKFNKDGGVR